MATKAKTNVAAATSSAPIAATTSKSKTTAPQAQSKPDYSLSNFRMLVLILLFIATSPSTNAVVKLVQKMLDAILGEKLFTDAIEALENDETPLVETTDAGTVLTGAGKSLATRALQTSFKQSGGGINAEQVSKTSKTNYLFAVGGHFTEVAMARIIQEIADGKFTPTDNFVYGREGGNKGIIQFVESTLVFANALGILDEAIENVYPDEALVNLKRNEIIPIEEETEVVA
jgi:hypothetical protein